MTPTSENMTKEVPPNNNIILNAFFKQLEHKVFTKNQTAKNK